MQDGFDFKRRLPPTRQGTPNSPFATRHYRRSITPHLSRSRFVPPDHCSSLPLPVRISAAHVQASAITERPEPVNTTPPLHCRIAVITGAANGIGRTTALTLAEAGADIGLLDFDSAGLERLKTEIEALDRRAIAVPLDCTDPVHVRSAFKRVRDTLGPVDILERRRSECARTDDGFAKANLETFDFASSIVAGARNQLHLNVRCWVKSRQYPAVPPPPRGIAAGRPRRRPAAR